VGPENPEIFTFHDDSVPVPMVYTTVTTIAPVPELYEET
jgi:hypothetical protein